MADVIWYQNNASPAATDTITVGGTAVDLTGASVRFRARDPRNSTLVIDQAATITSPATAGKVSYTPTLTDTAVSYEVPPLVCWWQVTLSGGAVQDTPESNLFIRAHAQARTADLCTVADVRQALRLTVDRTRDDLIQAYISNASVMIMRWTDREFAPASTGVTRTFQLDITGGDLVIELNPWDLRTATTVTLSPEATTPIILTSAQYSLEPIRAPEGVYKRIKISPFLPVITTTALVFGYAKVSIQGNWGFASVPDDVRQAAVRTVASWLDIAQGQYASSDIFADAPRVTSPADPNYGLPLAAQRLLSTYRRMVP